MLNNQPFQIKLKRDPSALLLRWCSIPPNKGQCSFYSWLFVGGSGVSQASIADVAHVTHKASLNAKWASWNLGLVLIMQTNQPQNEFPLTSFYLFVFTPPRLPRPPSQPFPLLWKLVLFVHRSSVISLNPPNTQAAWSFHYSFYLWLGILLKK